jgi:hypothetical protein
MTQSAGERMQRSGQWFAVFDPKDGRVVQMHQFICAPDVEAPTEAESRAASALEAAKERLKSSDLHVMQVPADHPIEPGVTYRVDGASKRLIEESRARLRQRSDGSGTRISRKK